MIFLGSRLTGSFPAALLRTYKKVTNVLQISTIRIENNFVSINYNIVEFTAQFALLAPKPGYAHLA